MFSENILKIIRVECSYRMKKELSSLANHLQFLEELERDNNNYNDFISETIS